MHFKKRMQILCIFLCLTVFVVNISAAYAQNAVFSDLNTDHPNYDAIMYLYDEGIIEGYPDETVKPDKEITRAELIKIIVESHIEDPETLEFNRCFADIVILEWYVRYACYAKEQGWVVGYEDGTFRAGNTINNVEILSMIFNSYGLQMPESFEIENPFPDVDKEQWYGPYVWYAKENGIIDSDTQNYNPGEPVTRGEAFEILYRTLMHIEELKAPVSYTYNNLTFEYPGTYYLDAEGVSEGFILFENYTDDGIAFVEDDVFTETVLGEYMTIEDMFMGVEGEKIRMEVKDGDIEFPYQYNKLIFAEDDITYFFKVTPKYSTENGYYVIGHYTNPEARLDVLKMIGSIEVV